MMCLCPILLTTGAVSLSQSYNFDDANRWAHFTTESGLPSNDIQDVAEAGDSTLWVIASSKLCWFDGFQWQRVNSSDGLPLNDVGGISLTFNNDIIVNGFLSGEAGKIYVGNRFGFSLIKTNLKNPFAVALDSGTFLMASNHSLYLYDQGSVMKYQPLSDGTGGKTLDLQRTTSGAVWINLKSGLYRLKGRTCTLMIPAGALPLDPLHIAENRNGTGIAQFEVPHEKRGVWEWTSSTKPKRNPTELAIAVLAFDIGPRDEAIVVYRSGDIRWKENGLWKSLPSVESRIHDITTVKFRANGDLVFGTTHGLFLFRHSPSPWTFFLHPPLDPRNSVHEIIKAKDGSFWIASAGGVEHRSTNGDYRFFDKSNNEIIQNITAMAEDSAGNIWIGSGSAFTGAYRFNGQRWEYVRLGGESDSVFIHKIRKDRNGKLWFLGLGINIPNGNEPGVFKYANGSFTRWTVQDGLINGRVYDFVQGRDGSCWFATAGGISRWIPLNLAKATSSVSGKTFDKVTDGSWAHWTTSNGLKELRVTSVAIDHNNNLWFASNFPLGPARTYGIGRIDTLGQIQYFDATDGLVGGNIWDMKVDNAGRLWVATTDGLGCYDHGIWLSYEKRTGLSFANLWPVLPLSDQIYVGTKGRGVAVLDLAAAYSPFPKIVIERPFVEEFSAHQGWRVLTYWGEVDPLNTMSRYRVNGGEWSGWRIKNGVVLNQLAAGEYAIEVQAKNLYGAFNKHGEQIAFTIPQVWYRRPVFYYPFGTLVVAVIGLLLMIYRGKVLAQREIAKSEERFRLVVESAPNAMVMVDQNGKITLVNTRAEEYFGYSRQELIGESIELLVPQQYRGVHKNHQSRYLSAPAVRPMEARKLSARRKDGTEFPAEIGLNPVSTNEGKMVLCSIVDITERKRDEGQKKALTAELVQTEERERRRMAIYLHDIIGQHLAVGKLKLREMIKSNISSGIEEQLQELNKNLDNAIKDSRSLTFELSPPVLQDLRLDVAVKMLAEQLMAEHNISLLVEHDELDKPLEPQIKVILYYAVRELFFNIIKHASASEVKLMMSRNDTELRIFIEDNGTGFDKEEVLSRKSQRSGFGLRNVHERMGQIGARFEIISVPQNGTRVIISVPMEKDFTGVHRDLINQTSTNKIKNLAPKTQHLIPKKEKP